MDYLMSYAAFGLAFVSGLGFGALWGLQVRENEDEPQMSETVLEMDPGLAADIEDVAADWASAYGRPDVADLLASKVKLAWKLKYRDDPWGW